MQKMNLKMSFANWWPFVLTSMRFFSRWIHILTNVTPLLLTLYLYIYRSLQSFTSSFKMPHGKWFLIRSKMTGYVLDVFEGNKSPGARVSVWEENGGENQLFCYHNATNTIRNKMNWFCLDAVGKHIQLTEFINSIRFNAIRNRIHLSVSWPLGGGLPPIQLQHLGCCSPRG